MSMARALPTTSMRAHRLLQALKSFPAPGIRFLMAVSAISRFFRYLFAHLGHRHMSDHPETRSHNAALARISRL
jgi:hypothetical protein